MPPGQTGGDEGGDLVGLRPRLELSGGGRYHHARHEHQLRARKLTSGSTDGDTALAGLWIQAGFAVAISEPAQQPGSQRQIHAADELAMVVDEGVKGAVAETDLARCLAWAIAALSQRLEQCLA